MGNHRGNIYVGTRTCADGMTFIESNQNEDGST
jgi:hypothetical protein